MGTSGVKWEVEKSTIIDTLKKRKGKVSIAAKDLNVHFQTLRNKIKEDPELVELLSDLRNAASEFEVDSALETLEFAMERKENDLNNALRASFFILNNKGKDRGYGGKIQVSATGIDEGQLQEFVSSISSIDSEISSSIQSLFPRMENEQSLSYQGQGRQESKVPDELGAEGTL